MAAPVTDRSKRTRTPRARKATTAAAAVAPTVTVAATPNSMVASAKVLGAAKRGALPKPASWQEEAWGYYDAIGEVRFACSWYGNALSRVRLGLARRGQAGEEPVLLDPDDPRNQYVEDLAGGETGQSQLLASFAPHLVVPGLCYLVGVDADDGESTSWKVLSFDELKVKDGVYQWLAGPKAWEPLPENSLPVQVWRPHARYHFQPDSPLRPLLPILRKLSLLMAHDEASGTSRLAGNGILAIPAEATFPISDANKDAADPFLAELMDAMLTPIGDRSAASAVVPLLMRVPGEHLEKIVHLKFWTPFDEVVEEKMTAAITRFANGMDMPAEVLLGMGDANHWTAWQIEEGAVKLHVVPMLETITQALTIGWWRPMTDALAAEGEPVDEAEDLIVWYDLAGLVVRPDRSGDAKDLYNMDAIGLKALLRECGFSEDDLPTDEESLRKVILNIVAGAPNLAPILLPAIGIDLQVPDDAAALPTDGTPVGEAAAAAAPEAATTGPPARPAPADAPTGPDAETDAVTAGAAEAGLLAACDALVWRALERAGNRLSNPARAAGQDLSGTAAELRHTVADATCLTDLDRLLEGAWDRVPDVCARYGVDAEPVRDVLDRYTRALMAAQAVHTYDGLSAVLVAD